MSLYKIIFLVVLILVNAPCNAVFLEKEIVWEVSHKVKPHSDLPIVRLKPHILDSDKWRAQEQLDAYFNTSLLATREKEEEGDTLKFVYPHFLVDLQDFYVDPHIKTSLGEIYPTLTLAHIPFFWRSSFPYFESLNDNWTLFSWSRVMQTAYESIKREGKKIVIYHLDDHTDMMSPLVHDQGGSLFTLLQDRRICLQDPTSVKEAIELGGIPIGAFLTVFLYHYKDVPIFIKHLTNRETYIKEGIQRISYETHPDSLFPDKNRIRCHIGKEDGDFPHFYYASNVLEDILDGFDERDINFLHIDLDYFNDRYDGDTNWRQRARIFDPLFKGVFSTMKHCFGLLSQKKWESVAVAYSPGFFPAEFWPRTSQELNTYFYPK